MSTMRLYLRPSRETFFLNSSMIKMFYVDQPSREQLYFIQTEQSSQLKSRPASGSLCKSGWNLYQSAPFCFKLMLNNCDYEVNPRDLALWTERQDLRILHVVSFTISPASQPSRCFSMNGAFNGAQLGLAEHTHSLVWLQGEYWYLCELCCQCFYNAFPVLLSSPIEPVLLGWLGSPAVVKTKLDTINCYKLIIGILVFSTV